MTSSELVMSPTKSSNLIFLIGSSNDFLRRRIRSWSHSTASLAKSLEPIKPVAPVTKMRINLPMLIPNPAIPIKVIFEDESIIVINKPAGIPCLPLKSGEGKTLANGIAARWPDAELVHRLDNDTSALIIASKNPGALKDLRLQFDDEKVLKEYTALVLGEPPPKGIIETPIIHDLRNKKKMKVAKAG